MRMWLRFLRPIKDNRKMYCIGAGIMSSWFLFDIFSVWIVKYVGNLIERGDTESLYTIII